MYKDNCGGVSAGVEELEVILCLVCCPLQVSHRGRTVVKAKPAVTHSLSQSLQRGQRCMFCLDQI